MAAGELIVQAKDLTRRFGKLDAVNGLSFDVRRGEIFGLLGPDGAGKTTTLRLLTAILGAILIWSISIFLDYVLGVLPPLGYMQALREEEAEA